MITVTKQKPLEEVMQSIEGCQKVYVIGCGTCTTMLHTGGKTEVIAMKQQLEAAGKEVTGWMVIPTACDPLAREALAENIADVTASDCILIMTCAFGVQNIALYTDKQAYPALNTLFIGKEESPGCFTEVCGQCGTCVLAHTGAVCPVVRCAKGLLNGPCGGSVAGRCEVSKDIPCAWQLIIDRMAAQGRLDELDEIEPLKDWSTSFSGGPRRIIVSAKND
ncbi:MAG: methylenetetrahydrofolate reductase C-terminal domain-containing protein [Chloroflexi bacterium]|nr:methylenetetrahydrofolate reductase C-terminal domain-containing protein [Chloroflexota bacterium]